MTTRNQLSQLQIEHQLILDSAGEGIYGLDSDGRITFSNAAATEILGWKHEDVVGQHAHTCITIRTPMAHRIHETNARSMRHSSTVRFTVSLTKSSGTSMVLSCRSNTRARPF